jgi:hypothetical protein
MQTAVHLMLYLLSKHDITVVNVHTSTLIVTNALSLVIYGKLLSVWVYLWSEQNVIVINICTVPLKFEVLL